MALPDVITMLTGTQTRELTLTVAGANGRRFALAKAQGDPQMKFTEIASQVLSEPADGEETLIETLKKSGATDEQVEAAIGHYRLQRGFADQVSPELFGEVAKAAEYITVEKAKAKKADDEDEDDDDKKPAFLKEKKMTKKTDDAIPEAVQKSLDAKDTEIAELRKSVADETAKRERAELLDEVTKSFAHVPGKSPDELTDMLVQARAAGGELEKSLREQWTKTNEAVQKSALITSGGSPLTKNITGGAIDTMNAKARERVAKSETGLTFDGAFVEVMDAEPELYARYLEENPKQTA